MSIKSRSKAHTRYYTKDETLVVGVTTVVKLEAKPSLIGWANNQGLKGIDTKLLLHNTSRVGTLAHYLVECDLNGDKPELKEYSAEEIAEAKIPYRKFKDWINEQKDFDLLFTEKRLVSEEHRFGGTIDILAKVNGKMTLIDLKTSGRIYDSHKTQLSAYQKLLEENDYHIDDSRILRIGRGKQGGFEDVRVDQIDLRWQKFLILLELYNKNKKLKEAK